MEEAGGGAIKQISSISFGRRESTLYEENELDPAAVNHEDTNLKGYQDE